MVRNPKFRPSAGTRAASAVASTISGVATRTAAVARATHANRRDRRAATAIPVPNTTASTVVTAARRRLTPTDRRSARSFQASWYHCQVAPCQAVDNGLRFTPDTATKTRGAYSTTSTVPSTTSDNAR